MSVPVLRAPPFPGIASDVAAVSRIVTGASAAARDPTTLFAAIRAMRVGGPFWAATPPVGRFEMVVRARTRADLAVAAGDTATLWLLPRAAWSRGAAARLRRSGAHAAIGTIDPWPLLDAGATIVAHGDDEWVALARVAGLPVRLLSAGRYGMPGDTPADAEARVAAAMLDGSLIDTADAGPDAIADSVGAAVGWTASPTAIPSPIGPRRSKRRSRCSATGAARSTPIAASRSRPALHGGSAARSRGSCGRDGHRRSCARPAGRWPLRGGAAARSRCGRRASRPR